MKLEDQGGLEGVAQSFAQAGDTMTLEDQGVLDGVAQLFTQEA